MWISFIINEINNIVIRQTTGNKKKAQKKFSKIINNFPPKKNKLNFINNINSSEKGNKSNKKSRSKIKLGHINNQIKKKIKLIFPKIKMIQI